MKKRIIAFLLICLFNLALVPALMAYGAGEISVYLNGERLKFDVPPQIIDGRTIVPMCVIFEAFSAEAEWESDTQIAAVFPILRRNRFGNLTANTYQIRLQINNLTVIRRRPLTVFDADGTISRVFVDEKKMELDVPPQIIDGRTFVPLRAVSEIFDAEVMWNADTRTVTIETQQDASNPNLPNR